MRKLVEHLSRIWLVIDILALLSDRSQVVHDGVLQLTETILQVGQSLRCVQTVLVLRCSHYNMEVEFWVFGLS